MTSVFYEKRNIKEKW